MTEEKEDIIYTRRTSEESLNDDDERTIVVGNLPSLCVEDFIVNFFENRRQFGDNIEVIKVEMKNEEAFVTFKNTSDVDTVLQRHARTPCRLGQKELTIKSWHTSSADEDSIVVLDYYSDSHQGTSKNIQLSLSSSIWRQDSMLSVCSTSATQIDNGDLFGSGRYSSSFIGEQISEIKLVLCLSSQERVEHTLKLCESELNPITVSYVATTTSSYQPESHLEQSRYAPDRAPSRQITLLQDRLQREFGTAVIYDLDNKILILTIYEKHDCIDTIDDFEKAVLALLKSLDSEIMIQSLEADTEEKLSLIVKHFHTFIHQRPQIKLYRIEHDLSLFILMQTENEKHLVALHTDIVKHQKVVEQEKALSLNESFKIEACKQKINGQGANVLIENGKIYIRGFQEDVLATTNFVNQILCTQFCESKELEDFAIELMKDSNIYKEIAQELTDARFKVWFCIYGNSVFVVGNNLKHVKASAEQIRAHFDATELEIEEHMLESMPWDRLKRRAKLEHPGTLYIDDKAKRSVVSIKSTAAICRKVAGMLEDFKLRYTRIEKKVTLTETKCEFILQHLKKEMEEANNEEFLKMRQDADKVSLHIEGTQQGVNTVEEKIKEVSTLKFWIADEKFADWLKQMSLQRDTKWDKSVHVYENQTQIIYGTGKIETEQVDVIVNSASDHLNLNVGQDTVTQAIFSAAGPEAQMDLYSRHKPVPLGSVVVGKSGNLKCKKIFHAVLGPFCPVDEHASKATLGQVVTDCLCKAWAGGYVSIAFPAVCTGVHGYPVRLVAQTMLDSIVAYVSQNEKTTLKQIIIMFLDKDKEKKQIFEEYKKERQEKLNRLAKEKIVLDTTAWPCRYYCNITAASRECACDFTKEIKAELLQQKFVKK